MGLRATHGITEVPRDKRQIKIANEAAKKKKQNNMLVFLWKIKSLKIKRPSRKSHKHRKRSRGLQPNENRKGGNAFQTRRKKNLAPLVVLVKVERKKGTVRLRLGRLAGQTGRKHSKIPRTATKIQEKRQKRHESCVNAKSNARPPGFHLFSALFIRLHTENLGE